MRPALRNAVVANDFVLDAGVGLEKRDIFVYWRLMCYWAERWRSGDEEKDKVPGGAINESKGICPNFPHSFS